MGIFSGSLRTPILSEKLLIRTYLTAIVGDASRADTNTKWQYSVAIRKTLSVRQYVVCHFANTAAKISLDPLEFIFEADSKAF